MKHLEIRPLEDRDIEPMSAAFRALGWAKPRSQYERYLAEQRQGRRAVFVAFVAGDFAGYLTIRWTPDYTPFGTPGSRRFKTSTYFRTSGARASGRA